MIWGSTPIHVNYSVLFTAFYGPREGTLDRIDSVATVEAADTAQLSFFWWLPSCTCRYFSKLPLHSYDATLHIFFASHYVHHWFDPWNVKWYAGFSQTTYPPLPQQWIAVLSHIFGLEMAYMAVQFAAILLLASASTGFPALGE